MFISLLVLISCNGVVGSDLSCVLDATKTQWVHVNDIKSLKDIAIKSSNTTGWIPGCLVRVDGIATIVATPCQSIASQIKK